MTKTPLFIGKKPRKKCAQTEAQKANHFAPGNKQGGRPKGSRNKLGEAFIQDFYEVWQEHGKQALLDTRKQDPATFVRVAASILPKEINLNEGESSLERILEQYSIEELDNLITGLTALGASQHTNTNKGSATSKATTKARTEPDSVH